MTNCKHYASAALQAQYGGQDCTIQAATTVSNDGGSLPFTGFDGGMFLVVAVVLVSAGVALRRAGRKINPA